MNLSELSKKLYNEVLNQYNHQDITTRKAFSVLLDERLKQFNKEATEIIETLINESLVSSIASDVVKIVVPDSLKLSNRLYKNSSKVAKESLEILDAELKSKRTIREISRKLYDGYDFNDKEVLEIKKKIPIFIQKELKKDGVSLEFKKYIDDIKTKPYRIALKGIVDKLESKSKKGLQKALKVALEEKSRYYANRIADTESNRAKNLSRADEFMKDDDIELVKWSMSSRHSFDICDYYANLDVGYGAGVVKKSDMIMLPLHPHCHCRYHPYYKDVKKRDIKEPQKNAMSKFSLNEQRQIVGSYEKLQEFKNGTDIVGLFNRVRPDYPIGFYRDVLNNGEMEVLTKK